MTGSASHQDGAPEGFATRVRSALAWRWGSQLVSQFITWGSTIMVVRLLVPADYGLFAMTQVVVTALNFLNGWSFATSLIQAERVEKRQIGQVFALLLMMNGVLAGAQLLMAPLAAAYYREPAVADILRVQALIFLTTPFIALPQALLSRKLEFRAQGYANLAGAIAGALSALALAWFGFGVWALVYAPILGFATRAVIMTVASGALPLPVFDFNWASRLIGFGGTLTLCQLFWIAQSQSDIFIAGRSFDTHQLGLYSESVFLTLIVTGRFLPPVNDVAFPAYAELRKAGLSLAPYFVRTLRTVLLVTAPLYSGLALVAPEAIATVFGPKWLGMVPLVAALAPVMPLMALQIVCSPATNASGDARIYLATSIAGAVLFMTAFAIGVGYGPGGLVRAWWFAVPALLLVTLALTLPAVGVRAGHLFVALLPPVVACAAMALAISGLRLVLPESLPDAAVLAILVASGGVVYLGTLLLGWRGVVGESLAMLRRSPGA